MDINDGRIGVGVAEPILRAIGISLGFASRVRRDGVAENVRSERTAEPFLGSPANAIVHAALIQRFAAPVDPKRTAGASTEQLDALNEKRKAQGQPPIEVSTSPEGVINHAA